VRLGVARLLVVGDRARALHLGAVLEGSWDGESRLVPDAGSAARLLAAELRPGDVVLVHAPPGSPLVDLPAPLPSTPTEARP
ncbi:MAG: UDP-N-acetylmuramoyl-tripeptide--D-alanyl-D-alanine ligase, partial [Actinomycetota bacterium]|nr:UDP-N-acetylmuramoyl-tripeptide--D-alanyl-D-alanine ligase [Actinomycetota bacterium]